MKKIKILHVQQTIGSGGVERRRLSMAKCLNKDIFDQKFVCTEAFGNIPEEIRAEGFEVISIGQLKSPLEWKQHKKVQKIIDEFKPDIIHGAVFEGVSMAAFNGWIKKVPVIIIEETSDPQNRSWRGNLLMKFFGRLSDVVIGVSPASVEYLEKINISTKKVKLINNGVPMPRVISENELTIAQNDYKIAKNNFIVGSIGRMMDDKNKRFSDLIKAFANFSANKENCKLLLVGDGPELKNYVRLTKDLNIQDKVIFTGYQSDVSLHYSLMNVFALVSAHESFGLVIVEAMLKKLPVIASRVGGMKYIVDHNKTGFLVDRYNINQMTEALEKMFHSELLRKQWGEAGYQKAIKFYSEKNYINKLQQLYLDIISTRN